MRQKPLKDFSELEGKVLGHNVDREKLDKSIEQKKKAAHNDNRTSK